MKGSELDIVWNLRDCISDNVTVSSINQVELVELRIMGIPDLSTPIHEQVGIILNVVIPQYYQTVPESIVEYSFEHGINRATRTRPFCLILNPYKPPMISYPSRYSARISHR